MVGYPAGMVVDGQLEIPNGSVHLFEMVFDLTYVFFYAREDGR